MIFMYKKILLPVLFFFLILPHLGITAFAEQPAMFDYDKIYFENSAEGSSYQSFEKYGLSGFEDELVKIIFRDSKYKVTYVENDSQIDKDASSFSFRTKDVLLNSDLIKSNVVYHRDYAFFTLAEDRILNLNTEKLKNMEIGVLDDSFPSYKINEFCGMPVVYSSTVDGIADLEKGNIDAWFGDINDTNYVLIHNNLKGKIEYHSELIYTEPIYAIISNSNTTLMKYINKRLSEIKNSGEFENYYMQYFLTHSYEYQLKQKQTKIIKYCSILASVLAVVCTLAYIKIKSSKAKNQFSKTITKSILKHGNRFVIVWSSDFSHSEVNSCFKNIFGENTETITKQLTDSFFRVEGQFGKNSSKAIETLMNSDAVLTKSIDVNGDVREIMWTSIMVNNGGKVKTVLSIGSDMTEKNRLKRELKLSDERYQLALESANIAIIFISSGGEVSYISDLGYRLMGLDMADDIKNIQSLSSRIHEDDREKIVTNFLDCSINKMNISACEVRVLGKNNEYRWFTYKFKQIFNPTTGELCIAGAFYDINDDKEKDLKIERLAFEDDLTGIFNRPKFLAIVKETLLAAKCNGLRYAVVTFNLDNFHRFNDLFGVDAGDRILKAVANVVKYSPYEKDCTCARLGNDEFALLIKLDRDEEHLESYISEISEKIQLYTFRNYDKMRLTISAGACIYPDNVDDYHDTYERSIFSMRIAKSDSNICYQAYDSSIKEMIIKRDILEKEIREAIEKKQFELYYQPKVDIINEKMVGVEALIRWNHPTRGIVYPGEFIYVAEEIGVISEIGKWTLKTACLQNKHWQEQGLGNIKISVNISSIEFYQADFVQIVKSALIETGLEPCWLEIELTESIALDNVVETIIYKMNELKELGVGISMDDFGTGYSSLSYLQNLPIDELKLDKSFIDKITHDETSKNIVSSIISLAKIIGLVVVAEGVEYREQFDLLKEMQCNTIQGYLFSKPLPQDEIIKMM